MPRPKKSLLNWLKAIRTWLESLRFGPYSVIALILAMLVGVLIPPQGTALRGLGDILGTNPLASATSLFGGAIAFLVSMSFGEAKLSALWQDDRKKWYFLVSGTAGAFFITFFSLAIGHAGPVEATLASVLGLVSFVFTKWNKLGKGKPYAVLCFLLVIAGTWLASGAGVIEMPDGLGLLMLGLTAITGFGVSWQFQTLGIMSDISSVRAAGFVSSLSGCVSAIILHFIFAICNFGPWLPINPWPTSSEDLWVYSCSPEGVLIIFFGTYASAQLKELYPVVMVSGNLLSSVGIGLATTVVPPVKLLLQLVGITSAMLGVFTRAFGPNIAQRMSHPHARGE